MRAIRLLAALSIWCAVQANAWALEVVEPVEGVNSFVRMSARELTRIAVEGGKIRNVIASDGDLVIEKDDERGQVFLRPLVEKPINIRVITGSGRTYSLVMQPADIPQEDVVLREHGQRSGGASAGDASSNEYVRDLRQMVLSMASADAQMGTAVATGNEEIQLWEGTRFFLVATYKARGLIGEKYQLHNVGKETIRVVEQELYRIGVIAVAVENMTLAPGQVTNIYVVRGDN